MRRLRFPALLAALALASVASADDRNWPSFRGHRANGLAPDATIPTTWNVEDGTNIRWTTPIPGLAHSSPVVWGNKVFLTTAVREGAESELSSLFGSPGYGKGDSVEDEGSHAFRVYCIDRDSGAVLWQQDAKTGVPQVKRHPKSTHANPTPACDAERVVAFFASEGLYCYDHAGNLQWSRDFGILDSAAPGHGEDGYQWGFASSPILHDGRVYVQCDVENESFVAALDATDGREIWRTPRDENSTWGTPTVVDDGAGGRTQLVLNGYKHIGGYDLETGTETWTLVGGGDVPVPTPVVAHGLVYITNAHGRLRPIYAIRATATGEVTIDADACEHMAWSYPRKGVYMQTPLVVGDLLYCCADGGALSCYDAKTGEEKYKKRIGTGGAGFSGSPVAVGDVLFFTSESGEIFVVKHGSAFELLGVNDMGDTCMATPAVSGDTMFVRTRRALVAIGTTP